MDSSNKSSDEYIDDALINKLLADNSDPNHFDLLTTASNAVGHQSVGGCGQMSGHSAPTVQEGMDLVDALDTLVQHLSRESNNNLNKVNDCSAQSDSPLFTAVDIILMDHNYCQTPEYVRPVSPIRTDIIEEPPVVEPLTKQAVESLPDYTKQIMANTSSSVVQVSSSPYRPSPVVQYNDNSYASNSSTASATSPSPMTPNSPSAVTTLPVVAANKSPSKTPAASRRSQRQIDRIEKTVLEKIKAENQEMLKREKESMESPNKIRPTVESIDESKDLDESELVIDFDKRKDIKQNLNQTNSNKKRIKRTKQQTPDDATNKKSRIESKQQIIDKNSKQQEMLETKQELTQNRETSELDDVIAALSGVTDSDEKTPTGGGSRHQRTRRKPKRWDDDEVEVDFSGQLGILAEHKNKQENDENVAESTDENQNKRQINFENISKIDRNDSISDGIKKLKPNDSKLSDEDDDESGSDFGSEDDPDKLWCLCRQPHDDRFMIGCDSCEEWFHGKCVNVTKQQGRVMEKAKQEWLCPTCNEGLKSGKSRELLKKLADQKRIKLEAEERLRAQTKRAAKERFLKKEKIRETAVKRKERRDSVVSNDKSVKKTDVKQLTVSVMTPEDKSQVKSTVGPIISPIVAKKVSQMPPKKRELHLRLETEESEKLKKLIKSSKKDLNKKRELMGKKLSKESANRKVSLSPKFEPISKVVAIVRKPEVKKKHKDAIDPTVQDLFKAEPIKKTSMSTPPTPTTPNTPSASASMPFIRKSSVDSRRMSTSAPTERLCPAGCGKTVRNDQSIYCNSECIESHVNETLKLLRSIRKEKSESGAKIKDIDRRVVVVEKSSGRLLSGKDGIPEKEVLDYIKANPMFEMFRPSNIKTLDKKKDEFNAKNVLLSPQKSPKRDDKSSKAPLIRSNSRSGDSEGGDPIRANVKTALKETLISRCKEANETSVNFDDIRKTANRIEEELFKVFNKDTSGKYRNKYRSLIFNLKDTKNQGLFRKVINGKISPERLVQMSADELASSELAKWREREKISMLEMIKRDAADKVNQVIVKKTHKGEELIESNDNNDSTNEMKLDETKSQTSTPTTSVSTLLDDLLGTSNVDTTSQHKNHLFSNNCRICTNRQTDDTKQEVSKKSSAHSQRTESTRPTPKRVRVDPDSANKILLEAAKLSSSGKLTTAGADDDNSHELPTSTLCLSSPEAPSSSSASRPVWKGSVFMQDVAKFSANAVKVSGTVSEYLSQDVSNQITVCGRIAPEQVLDYVKKLKYSSRTEIGLIKFVSGKEERVGYDAFFDYLDSRGRYGVVGGTGKFLKDFYILPLSKNGDVPEVLLPFDGPGLDKKSMRPNLLLGILIRSKRHVGSQAPQTSSTNTSQTKSKTSNSVSNTSDFRSYTPPPKTPSNDSSPEDSKDLDDVSYTPPHMTSSTKTTNKSKTKTAPKPTKTTADEDEPYDPEEADLSNSNPLPSSSTPSIHDLMEQIAKSSNPVEMTSSVLSAIASSSNVELQRRLLEQLTAKVDEQKRQLEEQKAEAEAHASRNSSDSTSSSLIPGLDGQFASTLKDIKIPDNLQDILSTVKRKTVEIEEQQERLRAVAASGFKFDDPIVKQFGSKAVAEENDKESIERTPEAEPMDLDEDVTPTKSTIIEVNTPANTKSAEETTETQKTATDPRLRSKKQKPLPSISQEAGADSRVAAMTPDELIEKAREQMAALAQMEAKNSISNTTPTTNNSNNSQKIKIEWKKKK